MAEHKNVCPGNRTFRPDRSGRTSQGEWITGPHEPSGWFHLNPILHWVRHCKHCGCLYLVPQEPEENGTE